MHITFRNVNEAFKELVSGIYLGENPTINRGSGNLDIPTVKTTSRVGHVLQIQEPMTITYKQPLERVLFNQARDCNPFFHLYESLWMLAGRNDVAPLKYYSSGIANVASDNGETFNGAYGYRWRHTNPPMYEVENYYDEPSPYKNWPDSTDQLKILIEHLKAKPESRRAVLQMWNVEDDLLKIDNSKDVCCNLSVMFSIREVKVLSEHPDAGVTHAIWNKVKCLDMTVTNRSNDMIWGMLGANVVHFSFLQEYMAASIGVEVGVYNQFTNNLHVYTETNSGFHPEKWLADKTEDRYTNGVGNWNSLRLIPLVRDPVMFDREVVEFVELNKDGNEVNQHTTWAEPFLNEVAQPLCHAWHMYKAKDYSAALHWCYSINADDWRIACTNWINKRKENYDRKSSGTTSVD